MDLIFTEFDCGTSTSGPLPVLMELELRGARGRDEDRRNPLEQAEITGIDLNVDWALATFDLRPLGAANLRGVLAIDLHDEYAPRLIRLLSNDFRLPYHLHRRLGLAMWNYLSPNMFKDDGDWVSCEYPDFGVWLDERLTYAESAVIRRLVARRTDRSVRTNRLRPFITVRN